jgi:hypothetical protein
MAQALHSLACHGVWCPSPCLSCSPSCVQGERTLAGLVASGCCVWPWRIARDAFEELGCIVTYSGMHRLCVVCELAYYWSKTHVLNVLSMPAGCCRAVPPCRQVLTWQLGCSSINSSWRLLGNRHRTGAKAWHRLAGSTTLTYVTSSYAPCQQLCF